MARKKTRVVAKKKPAAKAAAHSKPKAKPARTVVPKPPRAVAPAAAAAPATAAVAPNVAELQARVAAIEHVLLRNRLCDREDLRRARALIDQPGVRS